jgi:adenine deaminase
MNLRYTPKDFVVKANGTKKIRVIEIVPNQIVTKEIILAPKIEMAKSSPTPRATF